MSQKFQAGVHHRDDVTFVKLSGVIDEDNELNELVDKITGTTAVIDLGDIERINSCGVRDWVNWLGKIEDHASVVLVESSPAIVAQINLVNNFTGTGVVKSFYVPYFCDVCDEEKVLLVEANDMGPPPHEPPVCRCDECEGVMEFDDMPDSYFAFLSNQKKLPDPDRVNRLVNEFQQADGEKSKIRTRVSGTNLTSGHSALPDVPSLPPLRKTGVGGSKPGSIVGSSPSNPQVIPPTANPPAQTVRSGGAPAKNGAVVYILVGLLLLAIGVLAFLLFAGN